MNDSLRGACRAGQVLPEPDALPLRTLEQRRLSLGGIASIARQPLALEEPSDDRA